MPEIVTADFVLDRPTLDDVDEIFAIERDPRVWTHFPSGRVTRRADAAATLGRRILRWERDGLEMWMVRERASGPIIGFCGCSLRGGTEAEPKGPDSFWNLGYRFSPEAQGRGLATAVSLLAIDRAREVDPELPVVAYLLEHNMASARVAEKVGLRLRHRAPDAGNPDPAAVRLVFADRELTPAQLAATLR